MSFWDVNGEALEQAERKKTANEGEALRLLVARFLDQVMEALSSFELRLPGWWTKS